LRLTHILLMCIAFSANAQYYLRGEVRDEKNQPLQNVRIIQLSNHYAYSTGSYGSFGFITNTLYDSLQLLLEGYETRTVQVKCDQWQNITMKVLTSNANRNKIRLISVTKDFSQSNRKQWVINEETYFQLVENESVDAAKYPNTGFALNINKASYSNVRRFINMHSPVPPDAVRTEEMLNYFNLRYREPAKGEDFRMESQLTGCPWDMEKQLLFVNVNARKIDLDKVPPGNFVFLIDVSGSMDLPNRLPLLKAAFQMLVRHLRDKDTVSIVTYGGTVGIWMQPTSGAEKEKIIQRIEELNANGDTPGEAAIMTAYQLAKNTFIQGGSNRVILATDGDFNVGLTSEKAMDDLITKERQSGVYLTCLGVGMGNFKDSKLETLAKRGNGNFAYLDDLQEAEKVLVKELTQTFYAVADDVYMNIRFNPKYVKEYRLVGFDNRRDAVNNLSIDLEGGEIGSGNSLMAVFEIVPASDQLFKASDQAGNEGMAQVSLHYGVCNDTLHKEMKMQCPLNYNEFKNLDKELQFATAVTMFALKLKHSKYIRESDWLDIYNIAQAAYDPSSYLQAEFVELISKAQKIYSSKKKKRKKED